MVSSKGNKIIFSVLILLLFFSKICAASDTLYFVGDILISKGASYKYNLRFAIDSKNQLTGYSLTDAGGPNETKTKISGTFDSLKNTISFEEKDILRSKVDLIKNDLCFVRATLRFKKNKLVETLSGKFIGIQPGKSSSCADGEIKLINSKKAKAILSTNKANQPLQSASKENKEQAKPQPADIIKVSDDKGKELPFTGTYIKFTIWDNGIVDDDIITIMINNKYILKNYTLDSTVKIIETVLTDNEVDTVKVIALNEGTVPPNTALIKIESKYEQYPIEVRAKLNEVRRIYLRKKKLP